MSETLLRARDVVRVMPDGLVVLDGASADFSPGSLTSVVGGNGSGKSTLARVLAGVDLPDSGRVELPGRRALLVPEHVSALPGTSMSTLAGALAPRLAPNRATVAPRLAAGLEQLGAQHRPQTMLASLSKGTLQKAYLALAWALAPKILLVDEPFTGLDADSTQSAISLLTELASAGSIVVVLLHGRTPWSDAELMLLDGKLVEPGGPDGRRRLSLSGATMTVSPARKALSAAPDSHWDPHRDGDSVILRVPEAEVEVALRWALDAELRILRLLRETS